MSLRYSCSNGSWRLENGSSVGYRLPATRYLLYSTYSNYVGQRAGGGDGLSLGATHSPSTLHEHRMALRETVESPVLAPEDPDTVGVQGLGLLARRIRSVLVRAWLGGSGKGATVNPIACFKYSPANGNVMRFCLVTHRVQAQRAKGHFF